MSVDTSNHHTAQNELVAAFKKNDPVVLESFYASNYSKVEAYIIQNNGDTEKAKDIFQEAFIAVWQNVKLDKFIPANSTALSGYIYQIAKNKWIDYLRSAYKKNTLHTESVPLIKEDLPETNDEQDLQLQNMKLNFASLGATCKDVLLRFYYKKESLRNIAAALNWTEATARNNKYRCLQQLKGLMKIPNE
mgnify:CR=1 FL=1